MPFFDDADEVYRYIGGACRAAAAHPEVGPQLAAAGLTLQLYFTDPEARMVVGLCEPVTVVDGGEDPQADVVLRMPADIADRYWRGEYNLGVGIARGRLQAEGRVQEFLRAVALIRPVHPRYREMIAAKDRPSTLT